jgi:hypothetical protein
LSWVSVVGVSVPAERSLVEVRVVGAAAAEDELLLEAFFSSGSVGVEVGVGDVESAAGDPEGVPATFVVVGAELGVVTDVSVGG